MSDNTRGCVVVLPCWERQFGTLCALQISTSYIAMWQVVLRQYLVPLSLSFILLRFKECLLF